MKTESQLSRVTYHKWNNNKCNELREALSLKLGDLDTILDRGITDVDGHVDDMTKEFCDVILSVTKPLFEKSLNTETDRENEKIHGLMTSAKCLKNSISMPLTILIFFQQTKTG